MPIRKDISKIISGAIAAIPGVDPALLDELSAVDYAREGHGDLTTPVAMRVAKMLRENPRKHADAIAGAIRSANEQLGGAIESVEVAGPGFINIKLARPYWLKLIKTINSEGPRYGRSTIGAQKKVQLEFASANPTGPLSVAHGRQAALGDVLARIMDFIGFDVTTEYWINDCGNQINVLGASLYARYMQALGDVNEEFPENGYRGEYVTEMGRELAAQVDRKYASMPREQAMAELGRYAADAILAQILADFKRFGLEHKSLFSQRKFEGEGHVERLVERMKQLGLAYEKEGALWMRTTDFGDAQDRVLIKSDGLWAYRLSDITYHEDKFARGFRLIIDMLGPDHHGHIITMQAAMRALGHDPGNVRFLVVQHCTIIRDGKKIKMSTRAGEMVTLEEVVNEVGVDVARFFFLTRKTDSHLDFDLELAKKQSLDNPVYYVQYAHARIASIMRKAEDAGIVTGCSGARDTCGGAASLEPLVERDLALAAALGRFPAVLEGAGVELEPHRLTNYLQELAAEFHNYYAQCTVVGEDKALSLARLELVSAVRVVLRNALHLLGVHIPDIM